MQLPRSFAIILVALAVAGSASGQEFSFITSSFLGGSGDDDRVAGVRIQSDGTIVAAANLAGDFSAGGKASGEAHRGFVLRLSADGRRVLSVFRVAAEVKDLAVDDSDHIYLAAGEAGVLKISPSADRVVWARQLEGSCERVDAARDGHSAALASGQDGATITILDPGGKTLGSAKGRGYTNDVCIDSATRTVVFTGFRNARAHDGKQVQPVQIAYIQALNYDGSNKWCNYDWSAEQDSDRFLNKPTNNMADTRGYRCAIGRDGKLYVGFESAGGNHIFRYSPRNIMEKVTIVGGDANHSFHASAAEHKTVICRYEVADGAYLLGQQWCGRRANGRANAARMRDGDLTADESGRVYLVGVVGESIPVKPDPLAEGSARSGAYLLVLSADMKQRLFCTRTAAGRGLAHGVDARTINGKVAAVYGGGGMEAGMFTLEAVQKDPAGKDGFLVVIGE